MKGGHRTNPMNKPCGQTIIVDAYLYINIVPPIPNKTFGAMAIVNVFVYSFVKDSNIEKHILVTVYQWQK
jgi:hypothetical protein